MPLTKKGAKIMKAMHKEYGAEKGHKVFYASANKGTITGVHKGKKKKKKGNPRNMAMAMRLREMGKHK